MKQTRTDTFMEALTNVAIGFGINFVANIIILPAVLGVPVNLGELGTIGVLFTIISVTRSYTLRRLFNGRTVWAVIKGRLENRISPSKNASGTIGPEGQLIKGN
jgi:hypothetical protein